VLRQVSTASLRHLPARPLQAASGHPGGAGGDGQGVRLGGPRWWLGRWAGLAAGRLTPVCGRWGGKTGV